MTTDHAYIDPNTNSTWTLWNETSQAIETAYCDPVTGALLIYLVATDGNSPTAINHAIIDANNKATITAYNDTSSSIEALRCSTNKGLLIKIV